MIARFALAARVGLCLSTLPAALASPAAVAAERLAGPLAAAVEEVVDGDTLAVRVRIWLGQELVVLVRLRGIDAPERRGDCPAERALAEEARARLARLVGAGPVTLTAIEADKYAGRVVADVAAASGGSPAAALMAAGLARPYDGGRRRPWCAAGGGSLAEGAGERL